MRGCGAAHPELHRGNRSPCRVMNYALASHIHACATEAGVVVLDARRGKYSLVPGGRARSLEGVVQGWPALPLVEAVSEGRSAPSSLLDSLVSGGIVTPVIDSPRICRRTALPAASEAILDALAAREMPEIHARDVVAFFLSVMYASVMLKCRPFEALLLNLRQRKECHKKDITMPSIARIRECIKVFAWLRPFAYAESEACLFDSVALTDFLFRHGVLADFFVGVRIQPFAAHSWVQVQGFALNDLPEYLAAYTPILTV